MRLSTTIAAIAASQSLAAAASTPPEHLAFFETEIRPLLADNCFRCHSADADKLKANLYLDSAAGISAGGDSGPAVVPGKPDESLLVQAVRYHDQDLQMPPKSRLADGDIAALEKWVSLGAPWPAEPAGAKSSKPKGGFDIESRRAEHWSWRPVADPDLPAVKAAAWPANPVDHFILAKLESTPLKPARDADKRTLVRRLHYDLVGLPPAPDEVESFIADRSPAAYQKRVDALLASPHFGEKWGRHWLDLVRYGETYGHEFDYPIPNPWRYRDYVIRAFNADVPYDQLVTEHIAGDLLDPPRLNPDDGTNESVIGTGFWFLGESVHAPTDVRGDEADRIDNMIDVFSKSFLGLTVACARCHDHKFDAVSIDDYYALAGYLQSTRRAEIPLDPHGKITAATARLTELNRSVSPPATQAVAPPSLLPFTSGWSTTGHAFNPEPTAAPRPVFAKPDGPFAPAGSFHSGLYSRKLEGVLRSPTFTLTEPQIHLHLASEGTVQVRLVVDGHYMHVFSDLLLKGTILKGKAAETGGGWAWKTMRGNLDKYVGHKVHLEFHDLGDGYIAVDYAGYDKPEIPAPPTSALPDRVIAQAKSIDATIPRPVNVLAVTEGTPENEDLHIRGSHKNLGAPVPRRFLTALGGEQNPAPDHTSGRLELAAQVTDPANPLTARVYVNRLWHHLTGRGIVSSVDDFGPMGFEPSHPGLLDWLAADFVNHGWSTKRAVRQIVLSRTYRMDSRPNPANAAADIAAHDAENILLHHARVRRLTAEAVRDSILAVSGRLDPKSFGPSVPVHLTSFMEGRGRPKSGPLDGDGRRSIYTAIRRNFLPAFLLAFDMPSPFSTMGRRSVSNVPAQSLVLMNDPFVVEQSKIWAKELLDEQPSPTARIADAYLTAYARKPSRSELERALTFIQSQADLHNTNTDNQTVWADFTHALINKKEFIFLR